MYTESLRGCLKKENMPTGRRIQHRIPANGVVSQQVVVSVALVVKESGHVFCSEIKTWQCG